MHTVCFPASTWSSSNVTLPPNFHALASLSSCHAIRAIRLCQSSSTAASVHTELHLFISFIIYPLFYEALFYPCYFSPVNHTTFNIQLAIHTMYNELPTLIYLHYSHKSFIPEIHTVHSSYQHYIQRSYTPGIHSTHVHTTTLHSIHKTTAKSGPSITGSTHAIHPSTYYTVCLASTFTLTPANLPSLLCSYLLSWPTLIFLYWYSLLSLSLSFSPRVSPSLSLFILLHSSPICPPVILRYISFLLSVNTLLSC